MKPVVTIGVCVKNCEDSVKDAINSIIDQDFPLELMEIIVVDGYSKDKTLDIIKEKISKTNIKCKIFNENKGLGQARQIVVDNANGDYIIWVDGDMILSRDFVGKQVEFMEQNPAVGIGKGKYGMRNGDNLVATLENIGFVVEFKFEGEIASKPLGTSGCIYRVKAVRQARGFDENIQGVGEDMDAEYRIREAGWSLYITQAIFYEKRRETWKALWDEYFWHGYGGHYLLHKHKGIERLYEMAPPAAFLSGLLRSLIAYKITRRKVVFLLPLHWIFKRIAWCLGFAKGHIKGYGHAYKSRNSILCIFVN